MLEIPINSFCNWFILLMHSFVGAQPYYLLDSCQSVLCSSCPISTEYLRLIRLESLHFFFLFLYSCHRFYVLFVCASHLQLCAIQWMPRCARVLAYFNVCVWYWSAKTLVASIAATCTQNGSIDNWRTQKKTTTTSMCRWKAKKFTFFFVAHGCCNK